MNDHSICISVSLTLGYLSMYMHAVRRERTAYKADETFHYIPFACVCSASLTVQNSHSDITKTQNPVILFYFHAFSYKTENIYML